jgi:small nuclear ribonucleoprotein (snRNP)-like protein
MIQNKIVVRYQDGRMMKGFTNDFLPNKDLFHLVPMDAPPGSKPLDVRIPELKAVFFVKAFGGNPQYKDKKEFDVTKPVIGRKIQVTFKDGEFMLGTTQGYQPGRPGFFLVPADPQSNIERCFVVSAATQEVKFA